MTLNSFFSAIFCINLKRCPERRAHCERIFKLCNWDVEFVDGCDTVDWPDDGQGMKSGCYGANISHAKVISMALQRKLPNYLVFEDDLLVCPSAPERLPAYLERVPTDWEFFYLGWLPWCGYDKAATESSVIDRVWGMNGMHAVGVKESVYLPWLTKLLALQSHCDTCAAQLANDHIAYCVQHNLITQGGFGSLWYPDHPDVPGPEVLSKYL